MKALPVLGLLTLTGCVSNVTGSTYFDGRFWYSNVKSASDAAGGPRQDLIVIVDSDGRIVDRFTAAGVGTLQAASSTLAAAVVTAAGQAAGSALIRPSRNTTNVEMNVEGGAAGGGTSNTSATGGAGTTSSVSGTSSTATGGAGGTGTGGSATGSGGFVPPGQQ